MKGHDGKKCVKRAMKLRNTGDSKTLDQFAKDRVEETSEGTSTNTFVEPDRTPEAKTIEIDPTLLDQSASVASDIIDVKKPADGELTTTTPSISDNDIRTQDVDFFRTIRDAAPDHVQIPHQSYVQDSSGTATSGSRPPNTASESLKNNTFRTYPSEESETIRRALLKIGLFSVV